MMRWMVLTGGLGNPIRMTFSFSWGLNEEWWIQASFFILDLSTSINWDGIRI